MTTQSVLKIVTTEAKFACKESVKKIMPLKEGGDGAAQQPNCLIRMSDTSEENMFRCSSIALKLTYTRNNPSRHLPTQS